MTRTHTVHNPKMIYRETVLRGEIYKKTIVTNNKLKALLLVVNKYHRFFFQLNFNCTFNLFVFNLRSFVTCLICVEQCFFMFFNCFVFFLFIIHRTNGNEALQLVISPPLPYNLTLYLFFFCAFVI